MCNREKNGFKRAKITSSIEIGIAQGSERRGWLRSNDRAMIVELTFPHLSPQERRKWLAALQSSDPSDALKIELGLVYDDCEQILGKKRGQYPERVRLVKFETAVKRDSDVVMLWNNCLTLSRYDGSLSLEQQPGLKTKLSQFFQTTEEQGVLCVRFKLTTNITSKSHHERRFRFVASAQLGDSSLIDGSSFDFELVAKHRTEQRTEQRTEYRASARSAARPLLLTAVSADGGYVTCVGSADTITASGVVAELMEPENIEEHHLSEFSLRKRKRKQVTHRKHVLRRIPAMCEYGTFVAHIPTHLSAGSYQIQMVNISSGLTSRSLTLEVSPVDVDDAEDMEVDELCALFPSRQPSPVQHSTQHTNNSSSAASLWPLRSESDPEELLPPVADVEAQTNLLPSCCGVDLVPSDSEMTLGYLKRSQTIGTREECGVALRRFGSSLSLAQEASFSSAAVMPETERSLRRQASLSLCRQPSMLSISRFFASDEMDSNVSTAATA